MNKDKKLSPKQKKIAAMAGDPNKIEGEDFQKLKTMKADDGKMVNKYVSKAPAVKIFDEATKAGPKDYLKSSTKTLTEKGFFQPKTLKAAETLGKAAKATRYGKIATGVVAAGLAAKEFLKSKMDKKDVEKKSKGGMTIGKGKDYIKDLI